MQFNSFSDFINMGSYGFYVWLSYGAAAVILTFLLIKSKSGHLHTMKQIAKRKHREDKLREARELRKKQSHNKAETSTEQSSTQTSTVTSTPTNKALNEVTE
ncbi:heme exporter protein CcmD [Colwellia echini]|uniref:Heme exporter protein D n=1 Tax=Colwellia echini TaxID=1982103 RepID=A0ABY3MXH1_9GAMM|nr:heme exporter protein CcmD [Colwellia echini]TYK65884.1 heme exporter protein CcmD [Colwellia echini]